MINKRIFGAPIPINVQKKLEARQLAAVGDKKPLDEINSNYKDERPDAYKYNELIPSNFNMEADLSSRTPFARMWTGVSLVNEREFEIKKSEDGVDDSTSTTIETSNKSADDLDKINKVLSQVKYKELERTIYVIGTNNLSTLDNSLNPNNSQQSNIHQAIFPPEHGVEEDRNKFLKPQAGITGVSSETEGIMGSIKKTEVKFIVHNFHDFDKIYSRFFLRPGAQIFVDFGWDALKDLDGNPIKLYDPRDILNLKSRDNQLSNDEKVEHKLFGQKDRDDDIDEDGFVTKCNGDAETVVGIVTDYSSKVTTNGSVECSVTITSKNSALLLYPKQIGESTQNSAAQFDFDLDNLIFYEQAYNLGSSTDRGSLKDAVDKVANASNSVEDELSFDNFLNSVKIRSFGGKTFIPTAMAQISGLFIPGSTDYEDAYMSWGFLEDRILNRYFGHGDNAKSIIDNTNGNFSVKIDSSDAFTSFEVGFLDKQREMEDATSFLVPTNWDLSYNNMRDGKPPKSGATDSQRQFEMLNKPKINDDGVSTAKFNDANLFNKRVQNDKKRIQEFIKDRYKAGDKKGDKFKEKSKVIEEDGLITKYDKLSKRVPLREIFINIDNIRTALKNEANTTFRDVVQEILDSINDESYGLWDWKLVGEENILKVNDMNYSETSTGTIDERKNEFDKIFKFEIMSKNSIVTNYETSFEMPDGDIGSMYAIQAMTGTPSKMNPISSVIESHSALLSIASKANLEKVGIRYLPDLGAYNALNADSGEFNKNKKLKYYKDIQSQLDNNVEFSSTYGTGVGTVSPSIQWTPNSQEKNKGTKSNTNNEVDHNVQAREELMQKALIEEGAQIVDNIDDYFHYKITGDFITEDHFKSMPLPMKLEISIYGISSLKPGDIFRVDYLPEIYMESVYFQVLGVSHDISSAGWYTTLETQFRVSPHRYEDSNMKTAPGTGTDEEAENLRKELEEANLNINPEDINNVVKRAVIKNNAQNSGEKGKPYFLGSNLKAGELLSIDIDDKKAYMWDTDASAPSTNYRSSINDTNIKNKYWQRMNEGSLKPYENDWSSGYWDYVKGTNVNGVPIVKKASIFKYPNQQLIEGNKPEEFKGDSGKDIILIDNFSNLKGYMYKILKLKTTDYEYFDRLFTFEVFSDNPIYVANPLYYWDDQVNRYNGYGSGPNTYFHNEKDTYQGGVYWPGEKCYLIVNSGDPARWWAVIPANPNSTTTLDMMDCSVKDPNWGEEEWEDESGRLQPAKY